MYGWKWWEAHKPRVLVYQEVQKVAVTWKVPGTQQKPWTNLTPLPLTVEFSLPVAPLEKIGKEPGGGVVMSPAVAGKWLWKDSRTLVFTPQEIHWVPATSYAVMIAAEEVTALRVLDHPKIEFTTERLAAQLCDFNFYTNPQEPEVHQVVGELRLNYPATLEEVTRQARLEVLGGTALFAPAAEGTRSLTLTMGEGPQQFYLRSRNLLIPPKEDFVKLSVLAGLKSSRGGEALTAAAEIKTRVPDKFTNFSLSNVETEIIRTDEGEPQQILFVDSTAELESSEVASRIQVWWRHDWANEDKNKLDAEIAAASVVKLTAVEGEAPLTTRHAFRFTEPRPGALLIRVAAGVKAPGGFELGERYESQALVPEFPKEVKILGKGNILALGGARKLMVQSRKVDHLRFTVGRVPVSQIQHLVTQNDYGDFTTPKMNSSFPEASLVQRWRKIVPIQRENDWQSARTEFDFNETPGVTAPEELVGGRGIFFVKAESVKKLTPLVEDATVFGRIEAPETERDDHPSYDAGEGVHGVADGWEVDQQSEESEESEGDDEGSGAANGRFVMITDLGLISKAGADGGRDVFVMSLSTGQPVAGVTLKALARNGTVLKEAITGEDGRAALPDLSGFVDERKPVALLAMKETDVTFLPLRERQLPAMDFSRFDIAGVMSSRQKAVEGFVFTERGIYRPGDSVNVGVIVRRRDWKPVLEGLPVRVSLIDSQGRLAGSQRMALPYDGFFEMKLPLTEGAVLGQYQVTAEVLDNQANLLFRLGRTNLRVEEFQPDRMKVETVIEPAAAAGWMSPQAAVGKVTVKSLFGEAASERRVTMHLEYSPADFEFPGWEKFTFHDPAAKASSAQAGRETDLGETKTDVNGVAEFKLPLETVKEASYRVAVLTEAFEREGGRSVRHALTRMVSPLEQVVGWQADGEMDFIGKDAARTLKFVALDRSLKTVAVTGLRRRLVEIRQVSVLTKQKNGNYAYVSTEREKVLADEEQSWPAAGLEMTLATGGVGSFRLEILDAAKRVLALVPYRVAGKGDRHRALDSEAELELVLGKGTAEPGEEIEIHLSAPYAGSGLVTFERDRVLAHQWFHTETNETTVNMRVPEGLSGTVYVNAAFVRSTSSPEVFRSPLSYAAEPLDIAPKRHELAVMLETPTEIRPGTEAEFTYSSSQSSRMVIYAVDEGIHQITNYQLPRPLKYFTRKQALEVTTLQWLDLLLPEYQFLKAAPAFGGDADSALSMHINPFRRRQEAPVVFWSGIVTAGPNKQAVKWQVPDYFNGNLRVMAVAVREDSIGVVETATLVKAPIILVPNAPLFVTPGDEFEAAIAVTNHLEQPGMVPIQVQAVPSAGLEVIGAAEEKVELEPGKEGMVHFRFRAKNELGAAELNFTASGGGEVVKRATTLSVRPASHHLTKVVSGWFRTGSYEVKTTRQLYPQLRRAEMTGSILPLGLARGLEAYVSEYPHGCSEQITSRAMVKLLVSTEADFGLSPAVAAEHVRGAIAQLANRQQSDGGFGYWSSGTPQSFEFHSLYVLHFLIEAKSAGHAVPEQMMKSALNYAAVTARASFGSLREAELQAYAIYLMARNGENPAPQLLNLRDTLTKQQAGNWEGTSTAAWLAGTYHLLKQDQEATKLMDVCLAVRKKGVPAAAADAWNWYDRTAEAEALKIFYVRCREFPEQSKDFGYDDLKPIMEPLEKENFTTLTASFMTLALKSYSDAAAKTGIELTLVSKSGSDPENVLAGPAQGIVKAAFPPGTTSLRFRREQKGKGDIGAFFQMLEQGYDQVTPAAESSGLGVFREITPVAKDKPLRVGDAVEVTLTVRNLAARDLRNIAVVDLLPAGFEVVAGALKSGAGMVAGTDFSELREDRSLFYLNLRGNGEWSVHYQMKAVCPGAFVVPPAMAEDMYDRGRHGTSEPGRIEVKPAS